MQGPEIREIRTRMGISQFKLAKALGVTSGTLCSWELGRSRVPDRRIPTIVALLSEYEQRMTSGDLLVQPKRSAGATGRPRRARYASASSAGVTGLASHR